MVEINAEVTPLTALADVALKMAQDVAGLKAVSQNLMHSNLNTTDGIYGILSPGDVRDQIGRLGRGGETEADGESIEELIGLTRRLVAKLERQRG